MHITEEGRKIGQARHEDRARHLRPLIGELTPEEQQTIAAALPVLAHLAELGMRARQVEGLLIGEAALVAAAALVTAAVVGTAMAFMFVQVLRPVFTLPPDRLTFPPDRMASLVLLVVAGMAAATLAGSVLLRRLEQMELLREE